MPEYICPRCGYKSHIRTYLQKHFDRKFKCPIKYNNFTTEECKLLVFGVEDIQNGKKESIDSFLLNIKKKVTPFDSLNKLSEKEDNEEAKNDQKDEKMILSSKKEHRCKYCDKCFSKNSNLWRHIRICKKKLNTDNKLVKEKEDEKDKKIEELKGKIELLLNNEPKIHIHNIQNNIQNIHGDQNVNIYINAFGKENIDYITDRIVNKILDSPMTAVPKLLQHIHFHPNHIENHNIYISNKKFSLAKIYDGKNWVYTKKKTAIEDMANKALNIIEESSNNRIIDIKENYLKGDKPTINRIHDETEIMILNESENVNKNKLLI